MKVIVYLALLTFSISSFANLTGIVEIVRSGPPVSNPRGGPVTAKQNGYVTKTGFCKRTIMGGQGSNSQECNTTIGGCTVFCASVKSGAGCAAQGAGCSH